MAVDARYRFNQSYNAHSMPVQPPDPSTQRFCLRWNNYHSNLLCVFDQLLHNESFVDVTLTAEGRMLRAHKMVLSACSPFFQSIFANHPDKHPIVILNDISFNDMRCLLDFMYRGEVSVDQDRLDRFLRCAESLRIKGLSEINEDKADLPSVTSSLLNNNNSNSNNNNNVQNAMQGTHHNLPQTGPKRPTPQMSQMFSPLLGALSQPKRKRGRPRKLSGGSSGAPSLDADGSPVITGSPELLEVKMPMDDFQNSVKNELDQDGEDSIDMTDRADLQDQKDEQPVAGTSREQDRYPNNDYHSDSITQKLLMPKLEPNMSPQHQQHAQPHQQHIQRIPLSQHNTPSHVQSSINQSGVPPVHTSVSDNINNNNPTITTAASMGQPNLPAPSGRQPVRRRARRRATSASQDPAEQLTEMSVRGLNLFRYASVTDGVFQCTECAKVDVQKTFKNKYSFQRHAFLYHEGHQRKVFPCPVCQKEFSRPDKMKNHMKTVHDCFMPKDCVFPVNFFLPQP